MCISRVTGNRENKAMNKEVTLKLKGIAIIMMVWHHLFGCGDFLVLPENTWIPCFGRLDEIMGGCKALYSNLCICFWLWAIFGLYNPKKRLDITQNDEISRNILGDYVLCGNALLDGV